MPHAHRFFFMITGMVQFSVVFVLGITIFPLVCGLRFLCIRKNAPKPPVEPKAPVKPDKPVEPGITASPEEWNEYRKSLANYRDIKRKWKADQQKFKEQEPQLRAAYEEERQRYRANTAAFEAKVAEPARESCLQFVHDTVLHIFFWRKEKPKIIRYYLKMYKK
jgi:hypothetical protein